MQMDHNRTCSFKGCKNDSLNKKDCCFYEFPVDFNICLQWVENVGNKKYYEDFAYGGAVPFRRKYVCSDHFESDDFVDSGNIYAGIKYTAVPNGNILGDNVLEESISVKKEPPEQEFWRTKALSHQDTFPVEFLEQVKVEENSSQSMSSVVLEPLTVVNYQLMPKSKSRKAEIMAIKRANETPQQRAERLRKNADRAAFKRSIESEQQAFIRRFENARRNSLRRSLENPEETEERRRMNRERQAKRRRNETPEEREIRRMKDLLRARKRRLNETEEQARLRRMGDAARAQYRRQNESEEEKSLRRLSDLLRITKRRKNESPEERSERLKKNREYSAKRRYIQKLEFELNHPKNLIDDTAMSLRNFEEDITSMNLSFFQSLGVFPKQHEYHYIQNVLPDKDDCQLCNTAREIKLVPVTDNYNEQTVKEYSTLQNVSCMDDSSIKEVSEHSLQSSASETNAESQLVLL